MIDPPSVVWTIIVAAGSGTRFGGDKLTVPLSGGETVLDRSIAVAMSVSSGVVLVVSAGHEALRSEHPPELRWVTGGATRSESVRSGLAAIPLGVDVILIHDAARPLADSELYRRVVAALADGAEAVVPVVPVVDTVRSVDGARVDRDKLRAVQTPQGFRADTLRMAHEQGGDATDDATLVEALGHRVVLVAGDVRNLKITRPADIDMARALLEKTTTQPGD
jgi:2-C-methyl-D-erythritol 4-phosphate cytidylyltransferase